jgi:hypothetical protein
MKKILKFSCLIVILLITLISCNQTKNKSGVSDTDTGINAGTFTVAEKAALKIKVAEETIMFYTHDTKNQKLRVDMPEVIMLMDYKNKILSMYAGMWMNIPWNSGSASEDYFDKMSEKGIAEQGYKKTGTMTVIGKLCDVYSGINSETNVETKFAIWNGITLWIEADGKVIYEALAVTLDVPDNFFEQSTMEHPWIK